jgi:tyrosinase
VNVDIQFPAYDGQRRAFVTWRPVEVKLKAASVPAGVPEVPVRVSCKSAAGGGKLVFGNVLTHQGSATLDVSLPASGAAMSIWVGGEFPAASKKHGDVVVEVRAQPGGELLGSHPTMVRVRKNANALTTAERDRFLAALATLNGGGSGAFRNFRDMHVAGAPDQEAHGGPGFLPWHRVYLLDFERELQAINAEIALPYWRFDKPAAKVFSRDFMGVGQGGYAQFAASNPLRNWVATGSVGVQRGSGVGPQTTPALNTEAQTLALGGPTATADYRFFRDMQFDPHGAAHMAHVSGWITNPATAPRDPLFFLLHCNVDRLWSKWQWAARLQDPANARSFTPNAIPGQPPFLPGHRLNDRLWPWAGPMPAPRPTTAPGGTLAVSPMTAAPGPSPRSRDMIDYLGTVAAAPHLAFAYDDVPFQI